MEVKILLKDTQSMTVRELTEAVIPHMISRQYSQSYVDGFKLIFKRFNAYCDERSITEFSTEVGQQFLRDCYGIQPGTTNKKFSRVHRAMDMLADFKLFGVVMTRRRENRCFPDSLARQAEEYLSRMEKNYAQPGTVSSHRHVLYSLTDFLVETGIESYGQLDIDVINSYIKLVICDFSNASSMTYVSVVRKFLKFLYESNIIAEDLAAKMMTVKRSYEPAHLPPTLSEEQIEKVLSSVDRESPMGKRDYAILLLAARLGLRASDIRSLKPGDIDWDQHEIRITQVKTREPLVLPLPSDVGWAIIDYMQNSRPVSETPEIFLRMVAPYIPLQNLDNVLIRYMRIAEIPYERLPHHGLHLLRHSLATHMLEEEIPITTIQGVLGHLDIRTTKKYIGIDVRQLKECALEVDLA